jgi:large subunit ribosomal protein L13
MSVQGKQPTKFFKTNREKMQWYLFDAKGKTLGRLASEIVKVLKGKHKAQYTPNMDNGDGVIVINAKEVKVSGAKEAQKVYMRYSGYAGGLKEIPYRMMQDRHPERIVELAVKGMMPSRTPLGRQMLKKLRVFADDKHNMVAQQPIEAGN